LSIAEELVERNEENFSRAAITLLKGLVSRGRDESLWQVIVNERAALGDYFQRLGLVLIVDEVDEYAYLRQEENTSLPRLVQRYPLSYPVSMLLVELRKALGQMDTASGDTRLVLNFADIMRRMEPFLPVPANEMKYRQTIEHIISQVMQLGFLQKMKGSEDEYEEHGQNLHTGSTAEQTVEPSGEEGLLSGFVQHE